MVIESETFELAILIYGESNFYVPPETADTSFAVSISAVAMQKKSPWKIKFHPM